MLKPKKYASSEEELQPPKTTVEQIIEKFTGGPEDVDRELALEDHGGLEWKELCEAQLKEFYEADIQEKRYKTIKEELREKLLKDIGKERGHILRGQYGVEANERKQGGGLDYKEAYAELLRFIEGQLNETTRKEIEVQVVKKHSKPEGTSIALKPYKIG